jgi:tetratricopeptide (TPR) repeat protein
MDPVAPNATPEALDLHIQHLVRLGRLPEAIGYADQEIALLRRLATTQPATAVLGRALGRKGELLIDLGQETPAMAPLGEAAGIFDRLPADYVRDRAKVRAAIARAADQSGDVAGALVNWHRAATIWRELPLLDEERAGLAQCLNNAAVCHIRLGRQGAALEAQEEAAAVVAPIRAQRPDLYAAMHANLVRYLVSFDPVRAVATAYTLAGEVPLPPSVGWDLHRAAEILGTAGKFADAVAACDLALRVAGDDLLLQAAVLKELSADLSDLGRYADGADAAESGVRAWRAVLTRPGEMTEPQIRMNLATTLSNQGANLRAATRFREAAAVYTEAAGELRPLTAATPQLRPLLAEVLSSAARCHEDLDELDAAVPLLRELIETHRGDTSHDLARALLSHARVLLKLQRIDEAFAAGSESVHVFHQALGDEPERYEPEFASALFMTGMSLVYGDRMAEAVAPLTRSLGMAAAAEDRASADSALAALQAARSQDPQGVDTEWHRLTGVPFPGTV